MRWSVIAFVLGSLPAAAQVPLDPTPVVFVSGGARAEGCFAQWATRSAVRAYSAPTPQSHPLRSVDGERRIDANDYSESLTAVLEPGLVRARSAVEVVGARLGSDEPVRLRLAPGDELQVLAEGPEASVTFALEGGVFDGVVPGYVGGGGVEVLRRPVTELWVRLIEHGPDRPAAWLNTAQAGMVPREPFCP